MITNKVSSSFLVHTFILALRIVSSWEKLLEAYKIQVFKQQDNMFEMREELDFYVHIKIQCSLKKQNHCV